MPVKTLVVDIETTGLPPKNADYNSEFMQFPNIVSIAWKIDDQETKEFIINQEGRKIPDEVAKLHGITTEIANASPHFIVPVLLELAALEIPEESIGHNIYFDSSIIKAQFLRLYSWKQIELEPLNRIKDILNKDRRIDTMKSTVKFCNLPGKYGPKWPKLTELHFKLFGCEFEGAHSSKSDVEATYKCYIELKRLGVI